LIKIYINIKNILYSYNVTQYYIDINRDNILGKNKFLQVNDKLKQYYLVNILNMQLIYIIVH